MRPGRVVSVRVNPKDCLAVIDVLEKVGQLVPGMSFGQAVSLVLAISLETARSNKFIPTRDGFEYSEMMQQFPAKDCQTSKRSQRITRSYNILGEGFQAPSFSQQQQTEQPESPQFRRLKHRLEELNIKRDHASASWSVADEEELARICIQMAELDN
jgi:hypothetical protein